MAAKLLILVSSVTSGENMVNWMSDVPSESYYVSRAVKKPFIGNYNNGQYICDKL